MTAAPQTLSSPGQSPPATGVRLAMRQTAALFTDGLRRLRAAKLFWVALLLSFLVAAMCGFVGINERGLSFPFFGDWENPVWNSRILPAGEFYKLIFTSFGVGIWLAYAANVLALISTAGLVPALVEDGSVDLYVTRPLGRVRLFMTRYATGLLFVALQALCFSVAAMGVFAVRAGVFLPGLLWAVVYVTLFFSFLYCISALVGLLTGSGVTAILLTLLFWMFVWALDWTEFTTLLFREQAVARVEQANRRLESAQRISGITAGAGETSRQMASSALSTAQTKAASAEASLATLDNVHGVMMAIKAPLPKTGETLAMLQDRLTNEADLSRFEETQAAEQEQRLGEFADRRELEAEERERFLEARRAEAQGSQGAAEAYASRPLWWSIGTSLGFEAAVLALCCWLFARRDLS